MRYKIVTCALILSVIGFALAAPVPVREVREARADAMEGGENVIIVSGERTPRGYPYEGGGEESDSDAEWWTPSSQSARARDYTTGGHSGVDMSSSPSGGTEAPLVPEGTFKPGTTTESQLASSSEPKSVSWGPTTESQPTLPSDPKSVSWGPTTKVHFYGPEPIRPPPGREGYLAKVAAQQKAQSNGFKTFFGKLSNLNFGPTFQRMVSNFKTLFGKIGHLNFRPRFERTVDTGALTVGNLG